MEGKSLSIVGIIFILLILAVPYYLNISHQRVVNKETENSQYYEPSDYTDDYNW